MAASKNKAAKAKKKAAKKKAPAKKKAAAKPAKKATAKKASKPAKTTAKATANKTAKKAAAKPEKASAKKAAKSKKKGADADAPPAKKAKAKKTVQPSGPRHPKLGYKWTCFACAAKFYDLGKEEPICPKCGSDQRERPPEQAKATSEVPKPKVVRPMAQLLDDEEPAPSPDDEIAKKSKSPTEEMFDDTEADDGGLDIDDDAGPGEGVDPPEIDEL